VGAEGAGAEREGPGCSAAGAGGACCCAEAENTGRDRATSAAMLATRTLVNRADERIKLILLKLS